MNPLELQIYLRSGKTPADLELELGIKNRQHGKYPELYQFKYNQIDSPTSHPIVQESRGIVLDSSSNWEIVAFPFKRFANYGEGWAAPINWNKAKILAKVDGSLVILYNFKGEWLVATSGSPDASGPVGSTGITFSDLIWDTFKINMGLNNPTEVKEALKSYNKDHTFMFELCTPLNEVVVKHTKPVLVFLGGRNNITHNEYAAFDAFPGILPVQQFHIPTDMESIQKFLETQDGSKMEGFVVVDENFNRVKVKHPLYVTLHHLLDRNSPKSLLEIVRLGETSEYMAYFPDMSREFQQIKDAYDNLSLELQTFWENAPKGDRTNKEYRKTFAQLALTSKVPGCIFGLLDGKVTNAKEYLRDMNIDHLAKLLIKE